MLPNTSSKAVVRKRIRYLLNRLSKTEIEECSQDIRDQLDFPPGSKVAIFAGLPNEPQLLDLIKVRPEVEWHLPKVIGPGKMDFIRVQGTGELSPGTFGILEPESGAKARRLDIIVCPGIAFTLEGKRLGQGGGFYDRAILQFPDAKLLGVGFQCQMVDRLFVEQHDRLMDQVIRSRMGN